MCVELNPGRVEVLTAVFTCAVVRYSHQVEVKCKETAMNQKRIAEAVLWFPNTQVFNFCFINLFLWGFS